MAPDGPAIFGEAGPDPASIASDGRLRAWFEAAFASAPSGLAIADATGRVLLANRALGTMAARPVETLIGGHITDVLEVGLRELDQVLGGGDPMDSVACRLRLPDGGFRWTRTTMVSDGLLPPSLVFQFEDVTERRRLEGPLAYLLDHNGVTGLFNRRRFEQELDLALARQAR